ncbi:MAG: hypothetical protein BroJett014_27740 [Planctomycetota bacterium]|nr:MAG: hypothetical protein BroJett014_27740 [Planctomycetota bacterium]
MTYFKKLGLVAVLAVASVIWFPVLAVRGVFAVFNWMGQGMKSGMRHKDSGVMLVSFCGVIVFSPVWLVSIGAIVALAAYEIACFKLMNALYQAEDIGFRAKGAQPEPPPQRRVSQEPRPEARIMQMPGNTQILSEVQARQISLRSGWDPEELQHSWDSRRQCWRSRDGQLVDLTGSHMAWAS